MNEDDYNELFGVTPEGGQEPEADQEQGTAPTADAREDGSQPNTEAQDPQPEERETGPAQLGTPPEPGEAGSAGEGPGEQARFSPQAETEAGGPWAGDGQGQTAGARMEAQRAIDEVFALSGLKNPYTGQAITSKAEYDAYKEQFAREQRAEVLRRTGMTEEEFSRFIQDTPEVREARRAREELERAAREAREAAARVKVDEQLREIAALDPNVKSLADLSKMPTFSQFYELVRRGNTLTDAFKLANFDALAQRTAAGARQAAVSSARSKEHLAETKTRGGGAVSVPAEVREQYRLFNPDATEEEIQKHYQRFHKN